MAIKDGMDKGNMMNEILLWFPQITFQSLATFPHLFEHYIFLICIIKQNYRTEVIYQMWYMVHISPDSVDRVTQLPWAGAYPIYVDLDEEFLFVFVIVFVVIICVWILNIPQSVTPFYDIKWYLVYVYMSLRVTQDTYQLLVTLLGKRLKCVFNRILFSMRLLLNNSVWLMFPAGLDIVALQRVHEEIQDLLMERMSHSGCRHTAAIPSHNQHPTKVQIIVITDAMSVSKWSGGTFCHIETVSSVVLVSLLQNVS